MFFISIKSKLIESAILFLILVLHPSVHAQVEQTGRIEMPLQNDNETFSIISLDNDGLLLYRNFFGVTENQTELIKLDTSLNQKWNGFLPTPKTHSIQSVKSFSDKIIFFFKNRLPSNKEFYVYLVNQKNGGFRSHVINNLIAFNPTEFTATNEAILIGGYFNFRPLVLYYSLKEEKSRILPGFLNERGELTQLKTYADGSIDVVISAKNLNRKKCIWIRHFDSAGNPLKTTVIEPNDNKNLIFGRMPKTQSDQQVVAGVYGRNSQFSRGLFIADVNEFGEYTIHYYSFADLENFFHYMKAKREKRIKERIERRRVKGKRTKFNYRLMVHELLAVDDQFILLGEAFYPTYTTRTNNINSINAYTNSPWGYTRGTGYSPVPYRDENLIFDGFQYTHAVAIGFDGKGNLKWDNSFEITGIKTFQLEQFVKIIPLKDHTVLLYLFENLIRSKIIKDNQVIEGTTQSPVKTFDGQEQEAHGIAASKLEYWFGNHFFASGIQNIKSNENSSLTKKVFFINKIAVH